jgi:peptidoglycan-associated lipoprotein
MPSLVRSTTGVRRAVIFMVAGLSVAVGACRRKQAPPVTPTPTVNQDSIDAANRRRADSIAAAERARREQAMRDSVARAEAAARAAREAALTTLRAPVYFDYDASDIRDDARAALESKLPILTANTGVRLRVAGHTDSRGSDEYNLALGQRRASSVKSFFTERGIDASRIEIVSFGEERGTCTEEAEACWSQNRRAEFEITAGGEAITVPGRAQ